MIDQSTKVLLGLIAVGIWSLILLQIIRPVNTSVKHEGNAEAKPLTPEKRARAQQIYDELNRRGVVKDATQGGLVKPQRPKQPADSVSAYVHNEYEPDPVKRAEQAQADVQRRRSLSNPALIFIPTTPGTGLYVVREGKIELYVPRNGELQLIGSTDLH